MISLCRNHGDTIVLASTPYKGEMLCRSCASKARVRDLNIPALRTRELGARQLVRIVLAAVLLIGATALAIEPCDGARDGEPLPARVDRLRRELAEKRAEVVTIEAALRLSVAEMRVRVHQ